MKIAITGAAGLIGQNLIARLKRGGGYEIVAFDKHPTNTAILRRLHPDVEVIEADLAIPGAWSKGLQGVQALVIGHAQIGGLKTEEFERNNVAATVVLLRALVERGGDCHLIHLSSSAINSVANNPYSKTKRRQEELVIASGYPTVVLRPTLMFGWFDRKHLGWLARLMQRLPLFPVPGDGRFFRQVLYAGDLCEIIRVCLERRINNATYNISGQQPIAYIDLVRLVREAIGARALIVFIPYSLFRFLLASYALINEDPPFTTSQLAALVAPERFEVIDWPSIFGVRATPLREAIMETFRDPIYSHISLEF